jgi:hypothetical protein
MMTDATAPRQAPPHLPALSAWPINPTPCPLLSLSSSVCLSLTAVAHLGLFRASCQPNSHARYHVGCAPNNSLLAQPPCCSPPPMSMTASVSILHVDALSLVSLFPWRPRRRSSAAAACRAGAGAAPLAMPLHHRVPCCRDLPHRVPRHRESLSEAPCATPVSLASAIKPAIVVVPCRQLLLACYAIVCRSRSRRHGRSGHLFGAPFSPRWSVSIHDSI